MLPLLKLLMSVARTAARAESIRVALARAGMAIAVLLIAFTLAMSALGFGLYSAFIYLAQMVAPAAAAAIIAAALLAAAAVMVWSAWRLISAPKQRRKAPQADPPVGEQGLAALVRLLDGWARTNPWEATVAALTIGFTLGSRR